MSVPRSIKAAPTRDDDALLAAIRDGDLSALGELFDRHAESVRRALASLGTRPSELEDLVQQTFIDAVEASARFRAGAAVKPWLIGIAAMLVRRRRRSLARTFEALREWAFARVVHTAVVTPYDALEMKVEAARAWTALARLAPKKREAFVLVVVEQLSCAQAAEALQIPVATLWTRLHHARVELRRVLDEGGVGR